MFLLRKVSFFNGYMLELPWQGSTIKLTMTSFFFSTNTENYSFFFLVIGRLVLEVMHIVCAPLPVELC